MTDDKPTEVCSNCGYSQEHHDIREVRGAHYAEVDVCGEYVEPTGTLTDEQIMNVVAKRNWCNRGEDAHYTEVPLSELIVACPHEMLDVARAIEAIVRNTSEVFDRPRRTNMPNTIHGARGFFPWYVRKDNRTLVLENNRGQEIYEVDLDDCRDSAHVLDIIMQIAPKKWATNRVMAGLIRALYWTLNPQKNLCSFGRNKYLSRTTIKSLVEDWDKRF